MKTVSLFQISLRAVGCGFHIRIVCGNQAWVAGMDEADLNVNPGGATWLA